MSAARKQQAAGHDTAAAATKPSRPVPQIRDLREWWNPNTDFIWLRSERLGDRMTKPGELVDKSQLDPSNLRALWNVGRIARADGKLREV